MARRFHEGLQQHRLVAVALLPVTRQLPGSQGQDLGGQSLRLNPRQDQEAGVVDHQLQVLLALGLGPADEALAIAQLPGAGPEAEQRHQLLARVDAVAHLAARHRRVAQVVVARHVFVPQRRLGMARADGAKPERRHLVHRHR